jgi:hypothetical protein
MTDTASQFMFFTRYGSAPLKQNQGSYTKQNNPKANPCHQGVRANFPFHFDESLNSSEPFVPQDLGHPSRSTKAEKYKVAIKRVGVL